MQQNLTTLSQSKALATAGVKGESIFWWTQLPGGWTLWRARDFLDERRVMGSSRRERFPAYTLSELISICGEKFVQIEKTFRFSQCLDCETTHWTTLLWNGVDMKSGDGSTPIEAVTNLLLSIKQ